MTNGHQKTIPRHGITAHRLTVDIRQLAELAALRDRVAIEDTTTIASAESAAPRPTPECLPHCPPAEDGPPATGAGGFPTTAHSRYIAERLAKKFGFGDDEARRKRLYNKLANEVRLHPDCERIIADCVTVSMTRRKPGRWFCVAVILRLKEGGFLVPPTPEPW